MPIYTVEGPDGRVYDIEGPKGATVDQLAAVIRSQYGGIRGIMPTIEEPPVAQQRPDRTWAEAGKDVGAGLVSGIGSLVQLPGQLYGLATGNFAETGALGLGKDIEKYGESMKSSALKQREAMRRAAIEDAASKSGEWAAFKTAMSETIRDPALLSSFLAEQVPQLLPALITGGGAAAISKGPMVASLVAKGLTKEAAEQVAEKAAVTVGTIAAKSAGAVQQGADVGAGTYEEAYKELLRRGASESQAKDQAIGLARASGASGAIISYLANSLPGASKLEEIMAGAKGAPGMLARLQRGAGAAAGELAGEIPEEVGGRFTQNLAMQQIDPTRALTSGLGETAAMAGIGAIGMGGATGALGRTSAPVAEAPPTAPAAGLATADITPPAPVTLPTEQPAADPFELATAGFPGPVKAMLAGELKGKTRDEVQAIADSDPEAIAGDSYYARAIRGILGAETQRAPVEPSVVAPSGAVVEPERPAAPAGVEAPVEPGVVDGGTPVETGVGTERQQPSPLDVQVPAEATTAPGAPGELPAAGPATVEAPGVKPVETAGVSQTWAEMDKDQRAQMARRAGVRRPVETAKTAWSGLNKTARQKLADVMQVEPAPVLEEPPAVAVEPEQMPTPKDLDVQEFVAEKQKDVEAAEKERRKLTAAGRGGNLRKFLLSSLPKSDVIDISPDLGMRPLIAPKGKQAKSVSEFVANGSLDMFLAPDKRSDSEYFDNAESTELIKEKLRNKEYYTFETEEAIRQLGFVISELEAEIRRQLDLDETNQMIAEAFDEQRRATEETPVSPAAGEAGTPAAPQRILTDAELAAEEERLEREAIQNESRPIGGELAQQEGAQGKTPGFKRWSRNAPLVLAKDALSYDFKTGQPFVAQSYHGTNAIEDFDEFSDEALGLQTGAESAGMGHFSTSEPVVAGEYAKNIGFGRYLGLAFNGAESVRSDPEAQRLQDNLEKARADVAAANYDAVTDAVERLGEFGKGKSDELKRKLARSLMDVLPGAEERQEKIDTANAKMFAAEQALSSYIIDQEASRIPQRIMPLYVRMANPMVYDAKGKTPGDFPLSERIAAAKKAGHDGVVFKNIADPSPVAVHYVNFNANDIKSAIGNIGTYDEAMRGILSQQEGLERPTREKLVQVEQRKKEAPKAEERERIRKESEAGASQFRLETQEGRQDLTGQLFQRVFHGSPYRFQKFMLEHIGTGEGAQAYGWGLYFASKREIAEWYRENLVEKLPVIFNGKQYGDSEKQYKRLLDDIRAWAIENGKDGDVYEMAGDWLVGQAGDIERALRLATSDLGFTEAHRSAMRDLSPLVPSSEATGQLYEVEIPEDSEMLLWDKPLSEQSEKVREALDSLIDAVSEFDVVYPDGAVLESHPTEEEARLAAAAAQKRLYGVPFAVVQNRFSGTGNDLYRALSSLSNDRSASEALAAVGIKGIKYLDGTSRGAGEGSYNYVVFDDASVALLNTFYELNARGGWDIDPEERRIEKELTGKNFDQVTQWAVDNAPNSYAKEIARSVQKRIREFAKRGVEFSFELETGKQRSAKMRSARGIITWVASPKTKNQPMTIKLSLNGAAAMDNQNGFPPGMRYQTILHELLHAATFAQIEFSPNSGPVKALQDLRNKVVKHFNASVKSGSMTDFERKMYQRTINAMANADEMLAWGLTDRDMQTFLADIKVGEKSLWDRFVDIVRNILGLGRDYTSALEELLRTADSLLAVDVNEIEKGVVEKGYMFGPPQEVKVAPEKPVLTAPAKQGELFQQEESLESQARRLNIFSEGTLSTWTYPTETKLLGDTNKDDIIYSLQDKHIDTKRVIEAIKSAARNIGTKWDAYLQETLYHGRTAKQTKDFLSREVEPLLEEMRRRNVGKEELGTYLHNRHAEEANRVIAMRNPKFPDGGSGIKTADAREYLASLSPEKKAAYEAVAKKVDAILKGTRDLMVDRKMETPETIAAWEDMFQHYIPLIRKDADYAISKAMSQGAGYSVAGAPTKGRTGSEREVVHDHILANIVAQREATIVRSQKERVAQAVFGLAVQHPNPEFWLALDPTTNPMWQFYETADSIEFLQDVMASGDLTQEEMGQYQKEVNRLLKKLEKQNKDGSIAMKKLQQDFTDMGIGLENIQNIMKPPLKPRYDAKNKKVVYEASPAYQNPHAFTARINGVDRYVLFNANNPRAKRMAEALKNMDADQLGQTMSMIAKVTRYMAAINTQYNPIFGAYNFLRDIQAAALQISTTPIADKRKEVLANSGKAMAAIYKTERAIAKKQALPTDEWSKLWEEFQAEGGQTGFRDQFSQVSERADALQKMLDPTSWSKTTMGKFFTADGRLTVPFETMRKGMAPVFDWLSVYNETMENSVRLSAYQAAKEKFISQGMSPSDAKQEAARIAKELTVNFNRKGQVATQMGALYAFFNASVQGTTRMYETLTGPAGKKIIGGAFLLGAMQAMLLAAAGFGDDQPPDYVKERNIVIPTGGGKYITIPMPLGFNFLPNLSRNVTEVFIAGAEGKPLNITKKVGNITGSMFDMFNPIGNAGWSVQSIAPTMFDPLVALFENKDWTGKDIAREDINKTDPTPGYTRAKETATWLSKELAYFLNLASGGTDAKKGLISPTPDQLDYLVGQATGGLGREVQKVMKTAESAVTGEELPPYNVPVWGKFVGDISSSAAVANRFYENVTNLNVHKAEIETIAAKKGNVQEYLKDNPEARLAPYAGKIYRDISELRSRRREMVESGAPKERIKQIETAINTRMKQLNERVEQAQKR